MAVPMPHHRFTVDEYDRMFAAGILTGRERVELIEGVVYEAVTLSSRHSVCAMLFSDALVPRVPDGITVTVQRPIRLSNDNQVLSDIALVRRLSSTDLYIPATDTQMVIEIADGLSEFVRDTKSRLYAAAGIPEMWLIDLTDAQIERFTEPRTDYYRSIRRYWRGDMAESETISGLSIPVVDVLGVVE